MPGNTITTTYATLSALHSATNGSGNIPVTVLTAGGTLPAENGSALTSLAPGNITGWPANASGYLNNNGSGTLTWGAGGGGGGTVTSVNVALAGTTSSGAVTTSGTITLTPDGPILTNYNATAVSLTNTANQFVGAFFAPTNGVNTGTLAAGNAYGTNITGDITLGNFSGVVGSQVYSIYLLATNSDTSTHKITFPGGCVGQGQGSPAVYYVTNATRAEFQINIWAGLMTNINWSPHW